MSVKVGIGTSILTRNIVWCECGRGLSLTGRWVFCPTCGERIDQESYSGAVEEATKHGALLYRDAEAEQQRREAEAFQWLAEQRGITIWRWAQNNGYSLELLNNTTRYSNSSLVQCVEAARKAQG